MNTGFWGNIHIFVYKCYTLKEEVLFLRNFSMSYLNYLSLQDLEAADWLYLVIATCVVKINGILRFKLLVHYAVFLRL